jgi:hypothetical protein
MKHFFYLSIALFLMSACGERKSESDASDAKLKNEILNNQDFNFVKRKALEVVKTGFNAGDGYGEVWIRDYNTFIELSMEVYPDEEIRENLLVFFRMQGEDGNIIDGFIPKSKVQPGGYDYIYSDLEERYAGHKNTVETDQEASLVQSVYKYIMKSGNREFINEQVGGHTVADRLEQSLEFLMNHRYNEPYGLIWGATTADWGDVQPEHDWGVYLTEDTHYAIDIYDNAMFMIAIENFMQLLPSKKDKWQKIHEQIGSNVRKHLWDAENQKFIPHIYLKDSPFPDDFNENEIYYHGGTAVAIEAGLLSIEEIKVSLDKMVSNVKAINAGSIGLTMYPAYPEGFYEAYEHLLPMTARVVANDGFYEWYTIKNEPKGSGTFRGSAGVLYKSIQMLEEWAGN